MVAGHFPTLCLDLPIDIHIQDYYVYPPPLNDIALFSELHFRKATPCLGPCVPGTCYVTTP